jgi:hypothetical protein
MYTTTQVDSTGGDVYFSGYSSATTSTGCFLNLAGGTDSWEWKMARNVQKYMGGSKTKYVM